MSERLAEIANWHDVLSACIAGLPLFKKVTVLAETQSTQDAARRLHAQPGHIVVAGHQTAGRGQRGRAWSDDARANVAVSFVVKPNVSERLAVASGVAVARAIRATLPDERAEQVGIKWPNDIICGERKVAGILVEQSDEHAIIGVGVNVHRRPWPEQIAGTAGALEELGAKVCRIDVLEGLTRELDRALSESDAQLVRAFQGFDRICGKMMAFKVEGRVIRGIVGGVDPMRGIELIADETGRPVWLPAASTSRIDEP